MPAEVWRAYPASGMKCITKVSIIFLIAKKNPGKFSGGYENVVIQLLI